MTTDPLALLTKAERMLVEHVGVQATNEIIAFAEAARVYAREAKLGTYAVNHATTIKLRAELRLADAVDAGQQAGEIATQHDGRRPSEREGLTTLAELGVKSGRLAEARTLRNAFSEEEILAFGDQANERDRELSRKRLLRVARDRAAEAKRPSNGSSPDLPPTVDLRLGDFRTVLVGVENSDLVLTDPPYPREFLPLWADLAEHAARWLRPGGVLVALSGQTHLPEVMDRLAWHLDYWWCGVLLTPGPAYVSHARDVHSQSKPLLFYVRKGDKPSRRLVDMFASDGEEKSRHPWQQNLACYEQMVERLSAPGQLVVDPFVGGGTTAVACRNLGRSFIGAELDEETYRQARERLA